MNSSARPSLVVRTQIPYNYVAIYFYGYPQH